MTSREIKQKFIQFFESRGHKRLPPAFLAPENDTSVLFNTAGMQQFKRFYLLPDEAPANRAITIQPCVRTSDIDEVGDATHLTFFEMLGNFSFGYPKKENSYFKKEAILWAWEFLTKELRIDKKRISATYFKGNDNILADKDSREILQSIDGLEKIESQGEDNFWSLGTEGAPAGPTVEFYIDGVEIWNLVFNEYILKNGKYTPSEYQGVDTGMGLERLMMVLQGKKTVFETDIFSNLKSPTFAKATAGKQSIKVEDSRIIIDHLRAAEALAGEGLAPSNKEQGFILRRLIRRLIVVLKKYSLKIDSLTQSLIILKEAEKFNQTLEKGWRELNRLMKKGQISGREAFDLFQSYGYPFELTRELAKDKNILIDKNDFQQEFTRHQKISRASQSKFRGGLATGGEIETRYHTANHLLLAVLRQVLGGHIQQKGSNITSERLRFDFSHPQKMTPDEIKKTEELVNEKIKDGLEVEMKELSLADAKASGATGVFDDRYGDKVKVYTICDKNGALFSAEICGGPHIKNTSELGEFKITKEESSSAGVRRIRAKIY